MNEQVLTDKLKCCNYLFRVGTIVFFGLAAGVDQVWRDKGDGDSIGVYSLGR